MTRGDRKRNARRERLRELLPRGGAVIGIDLAGDKQALAVVDHDVRVLGRRTVRVKAFRLGEALDWAVTQAKVRGFAQVAVACEPAGPRWVQVQRLSAERGLPVVCIQPLMSRIAREQQDFTAHMPTISYFGSGDDHVTCAGRRVVRGGREAVGQDDRGAHHRALMRFCRSSRLSRWTASSRPGTW